MKSDEDCIRAVADINKVSSKVTDENIRKYLDSLVSDICRGNVEYAEWSNESIFLLMEKMPEKFFALLKQSNFNIQDAIRHELEHPIHDMINYPNIMDSIKSGIKDESLRTYAVKLFSPYYERHIKEVRKWEETNKQKWEYPK